MSPTIRHLPEATAHWERDADVVVVGSGAAGMSAALGAAALGRQVLLIGKTTLGGGSTPLAQGGLAAVLDPTDSTELHAYDTTVAGGGLCDDDAVADLVGAAPGEIARLEALGARFDRGPLGLEGGHSRRRIVHAGGDASGAEVHRVLRAAVEASSVDVLDHVVALDALLDDDDRVGGLLVGLVEGDGRTLRPGLLRAAAVVLASGGYGQAWASTTNPAGVTGDGLALAVRAGAEVCDVEFVQFHPTVLWQPGRRGHRPLITEALRGAGARVVDGHGRPVMAGLHPRADLAPRDVVAAAMHDRMAEGDGPSTHLWLDATTVAHLGRDFPTVVAACRAAGTDPLTSPIPVAPGAHYACGGIRADMDGRTSLDGLYAIGEVAATGVHGANRLASNSLTEALATGRRLAHLLGAARRDDPSPRVDRAGRPLRPPSPGTGVLAATRDARGETMSRHVGIRRDGDGLEHTLELLAATPPAGDRLDLDIVEATNLHTVSTLVALAALTRTESRGCHRRCDAPEALERWARRLGMVCRDGQVEVRVEATA